VNYHPQAKHSLLAGFILLALGVLIGAFGAHGLKDLVTPEKLVTFETGVRYHFYHGFALVLTGLVQQLLNGLRTKTAFAAFLSGILLFSFNCYLYVLTGDKTYAMIVPIGGLLFVVGWLSLVWELVRSRPDQAI
jgi:uncharacterized membrane protein YgdD (TMEM256/DUF423 family)